MRTNVQRLGEHVTAPLLGRLTPCAGRQGTVISTV